MTQYINLLNPALRQRREVISAVTLAVTLVALCAMLAGGHFYARQRADALQSEVKRSTAQWQADQDKLAAVEKSAATARPDVQLAAEIEKARLLLRVRQAAMAALAGGELGDTAGFSEMLRALARQSMNGLWLTGFSFAGRDMQIQGRALSADQVPAYIRRLNAEPAFQGKSLASMLIEEVRPSETGAPAGTAPYLEFRLVSSPERAAKQGKAADDVPALRGLAEGKP